MRIIILIFVYMLALLINLLTFLKKKLIEANQVRQYKHKLKQEAKRKVTEDPCELCGTQRCYPDDCDEFKKYKEYITLKGSK